jgi:hypothetical protein
MNASLLPRGKAEKGEFIEPSLYVTASMCQSGDIDDKLEAARQLRKEKRRAVSRFRKDSGGDPLHQAPTPPTDTFERPILGAEA